MQNNEFYMPDYYLVLYTFRHYLLGQIASNSDCSIYEGMKIIKINK